MDLSGEEPDAETTTKSPGAASFTLRGNFKVFAKAILALNRIGDQLYMEPSEYGLALRSVNCSKSAFGTFLFSKTFFAECDVSMIDRNAYNICRIPMKCALSAFKCVKNPEKSVVSCLIELNPQADTMHIELTQTFDVVKTHEVPLVECNTTFKNVIDKANLINCFIANAKLLLDLFNRMHHATDEITIDAKAEQISFRNFITREQDRDKVMKTEGRISVTEFQKYTIKRPAEITVNLKELKAVVSFADTYRTPVSIYFDRPGIPLVIALEQDINYTAEVILATAMDDSTVYDIDSETPVQIISSQQRPEHQQLKRKGTPPLSNTNLSENMAPNYQATKSRLIVSSSLEGNSAEKARNQVENCMEVDIRPPQAITSRTSDLVSSKCAKNLLPEEEAVVGDDDEDVMIIENNGIVTAKNNRTEDFLKGNEDDDDDKSPGSNSDRPPSRGPALFRYLFSIDAPSDNSELSPSESEILVPDSEPEENYGELGFDGITF